MAIRFFNTLSRKVEDFVPREAGKVGMYTCGPTVYNRAHIGNFRTFLFSDLLHRYLQYRGFKVLAVMNITDIDDRTIQGAIREGITLKEYTERYTLAFFEDSNTLGMEPADIYPRATEHMPEMISMVETLEKSGHAYKVDDSYFFKVDSFSTYGDFARLDKKENLRVGERVAEDTFDKQDQRDFALWKGYIPEDGNIFWDGSLGKGRPGWHLECSAMSLKYLGEDFDIHAGGVDLIFPHHQNEIAQTEATTGKRLAKYWMHSEHLMVDAEKMSKSLGNFFSVQDIISKGYKAREIRFALMGAHYRQRLNFTMDSLSTAKTAIERFDSFVRNLHLANGSGGMEVVKETLQNYESGFQEAMDDDLNYPEGIAEVFGLVRDVNVLIAEGKVGQAEAKEILSTLNRLNSVLGHFELEQTNESDAEIDAIMIAREEARRNKNWAEADRLRDQLASLNVIIEDRSGQTVWRRK